MGKKIFRNIRQKGNNNVCYKEDVLSRKEKIMDKTQFYDMEPREKLQELRKQWD